MAQRRGWEPRTGEIPERSGVYRFFDADDRVIYVGKAKVLRERLSSYFGDESGLLDKTRRMLREAVRVEWTTTQSEVEALVLEQQWIHQFDPRFNIRLRDGKVYPSIAVSVEEDVPRVMIWRGARRKGLRYFGPFPQGSDVGEILESLERAFRVRSCRQSVYLRAEREKRPCLLAEIGKCSAPCVLRVDHEVHRAQVEGLVAFMEGRDVSVVERLEREMAEAAESLEFEKAARRRDDVAAIRRVLSKQHVVLESEEDADVVMMASDGVLESWYALYVRGGVIRGVQSWVVEGGEGDLAQRSTVFLERMISERIAGGVALVSEVVTPVRVEDEALVELIRGQVGKRPQLRSARGKWKAVAEIAQGNAEEVLRTLKLKRANDPTSREAGMKELMEALELSEMPLRIECYDISHMQGSEAVASMVVFEDGVKKASMYRTFLISEENAGDDLGSMKEVLRRRFKRQTMEELGVDPETGEVVGLREAAKARRFALRPQLVLVDGGAPQVEAARQVLEELGITVGLAGIAKRLEEVWLPEEEDPVILPRTSEGLYLIQRVRDEAHRFAITLHRKRQGKRMRSSALDGVAGLGEEKKRTLLKEMGSVKRIRESSVEELVKVPGVGPKLAERILASLAKEAEEQG